MKSLFCAPRKVVALLLIYGMLLGLTACSSVMKESAPTAGLNVASLSVSTVEGSSSPEQTPDRTEPLKPEESPGQPSAPTSSVSAHLSDETLESFQDANSVFYYRETSAPEWEYFVENGSLKRQQTQEGNLATETLIEQDVLRVAGTNPIFIEKADGYVYAFSDKNIDQERFIPTYVGSDTLDYYLAEWDEYCRTEYLGLNDFIVKFGETHFPPSGLRSLNVANARFGQRVDIRAGATYYASADLAGSGASDQTYNVYTEGPLYLGGFAVANNGRLVDYEAYLRDDIQYASPAPTFCQNTDGELWCFVYVDGYMTGSIGWFLADDLYYVDRSGPVVVAYAKDPNQDPMAAMPAPDTEPVYDPVPQIPDDPGPVFEDRTETTSDEVASGIEELTTSGEKVAVLLDASGSVNAYSADIASYAAQVDTADTVIMFGSSAKTITADTYAKESNSLGWIFPFFGSSGGTNVFTALNSVPAGEYGTVILVSDLLSSRSRLIERTDIGNVVIIYVGDTDDMNNLDDTAQYVVDEITEKWNVVPVIQQLVVE